MSKQTPLVNEAEFFASAPTQSSKLPWILSRGSYARLRYTLWLASLREIAILSTLINSYDKIEKNTLTYWIVTLFVKSKKLKKWLSAAETKLRKRIY